MKDALRVITVALSILVIIIGVPAWMFAASMSGDLIVSTVIYGTPIAAASCYIVLPSSRFGSPAKMWKVAEFAASCILLLYGVGAALCCNGILAALLLGVPSFYWIMRACRESQGKKSDGDYAHRKAERCSYTHGKDKGVDAPWEFRHPPQERANPPNKAQ